MEHKITNIAIGEDDRDVDELNVEIIVWTGFTMSDLFDQVGPRVRGWCQGMGRDFEECDWLPHDPEGFVESLV